MSLAVFGKIACAQTAEAEFATSGKAFITSFQQYWDLAPTERAKSLDFRIECFVTYFDPEWKILFMQDMRGEPAYVLYGANPFPFHFGQRVVASGKLPPSKGDISFENAVIVEQGRSLPDALPIGGKLEDVQKWGGRYVTAEGFVESARRIPPGHVQITLVIEGVPITVWLLFDPTVPVPNINDATVRVSGVFNPKPSQDGKPPSFEIMLSGVDQLTVLHELKDDPRFKTAAVPIHSLPGISPDKLVRVTGLVKAQEAGRFVRIRDDAGQIDILTVQSRTFAINEQVEAIGFPLIDGTEWRLARGLVRPLQGPSTGGLAVGKDKSATLRLASQVLELSAEEAMEGRPVWLTGVVTWSNANAPFFFIQDSSGGVCIMRANSNSPVRSVGRNMDVRGVTGMGRFSPVVLASRFERVSDVVLPVARQISLEHALTGVEEAQWVEMRGYLRQVNKQDGWNELELATSAGDFIAVLPLAQEVDQFIGSVIRLHGVCSASASERRKLTGIKLWVPSVSYVQVEESAPQNPFDVPVRTLASLGQYGGLQSFSQRVRVSGVVLHQTPGHLVYIQDGTDSLTIYSRSNEILKPGDKIEAVGFLGRQGGRVDLREAVYRKVGVENEPLPKPVVIGNQPLVEEDGRLVSLTGDLIDNSATHDQVRLTLQKQNVIFEAFLDDAGPDNALTQLQKGSQLALVGVYEVRRNEYGQPATFVLHLRTANDVKVLQSPPWLTRRLILGFAGTLGLGTVVFIAWVTALRRRVKIQTAQLREQMQRELWLKEELQRASKLDSLGLLAGGIAHDFNNLLTVMMGNISLAGYDANLTPETVESLRSAEQAATRARDLTQQLLTFAKGGAPLRVAVSLPEVVQEVTEFALRGSNTRCEFDQPVDLWPANVDKGQIAQVVQNIVINALQAMPSGGVINISLSNEIVGSELAQVLAPGRYVRLSIADHGPGIAPENLPRIFDPYFTTKKHGNGLGLATVHSIVKKHLGHITVESALGQGTKFKIWLPAAEIAPAVDSTPPIFHPIAPGNFSVRKKQVRILFMDDEPAVRRLGQTLLKRMGHAVTAVCDGAETLAEYERARQAGEPYDLVILDLTIPGGMGGREAMEKLLLIDPKVKAIVSSGYSNDLVLSNYQAHGFRGMVSKPYDPTDLSHAIDQVLKGDRA
ncbi:MAG: ATP-binding protein [Nibricoccus sp.]